MKSVWGASHALAIAACAFPQARLSCTFCLMCRFLPSYKVSLLIFFLSQEAFITPRLEKTTSAFWNRYMNERAKRILYSIKAKSSQVHLIKKKNCEYHVEYVPLAMSWCFLVFSVWNMAPVCSLRVAGSSVVKLCSPWSRPIPKAQSIKKTWQKSPNYFQFITVFAAILFIWHFIKGTILQG